MVAKINKKENAFENGDFKKRLVKIYNKFGIFIVLICMMIILSILTPNFLTSKNLINVVRQISFIAIIGFGVTAIIITTGIDLSSGSIVALTSVVVASVAHPGQHSLFVTILIGLSVGLVCGFFNGIITAKAGIPPFIVTLGMYTAARGAASLFSDGRPISNMKEEFIFLGAGKVLGIPVPIIILIVVAILMHIILTQTRYGRHVFALGGNEQAAIISGISVVKVKVLVYTCAGLLSSLAGLVLTARINSGQPGLGVGLELDAIASAVIGGTSLSGGVGSVFGTFTGALVIGVINNGMDLLNINVYWQQIVKGIIIVLAVFIDKMKHNKRK